MTKLTSLLSLLFLLAATAASADQADVSITLTNYVGPRVEVGSTVVYRFVLKNNGPDVAHDVKLTFDAPPGSTSINIFGFPFGSCSSNTSCGVPVLNVNATVQGTIEERFDSTLRTTSTTANVTTSTPDPDLSNNASTGTTQIVSEPDLFSSIEFPRITEGEANLTLRGGVFNNGPAPAHDVVYTVNFPAGTIIRSAQPPAGWQCSIASPNVTCTTPLLPAHVSSPSLQFVFDLTAPPRYNGGFEKITTEITTSDENVRPGPLTSTAFWNFYHLFVVSSSADAGFGTLREAIVQSNTCNTFDCRIAFRLPETERNAEGWFTIRPSTPLPPIMTAVTIAGPAGTQKVGTRVRPEVMLDGSSLKSGNGLELIADRFGLGEVFGLAIGNFPGAGLAITGGPRVYDNFIGTLPNGVVAAPNERGIVATASPTVQFNQQLTIHNNVISGNRRSGITLANISRPQLTFNAIGLGADATTPVPNGASGVYLAEGADWAFLWCNDLAYNGDFGLAIHPSVRRVLASLNAIYANRQLGIDFGVDLATPNSDNDRERLPNHPVITSVKLDPVTGKTTIEGTMVSVLSPNPYGEQLRVELYADEGDHPQARFFLKTVQVVNGSFRTTVDQDVRGESVTAIGIRYSVGPWFMLNEQTSEISDPVRVE